MIIIKEILCKHPLFRTLYKFTAKFVFLERLQNLFVPLGAEMEDIFGIDDSGRVSLSQLLGMVEQLVNGSLGESYYWVQAELANVSLPRGGGHCYLELVETDAQNRTVAKVRANIWSSYYERIERRFLAEAGGQLAVGMKVLLRATVQFSRQWGFSLKVVDIDPTYTLGDMEAQKRQTLQRLAKEGLMDRNKELYVPALPSRLAIISAEGAAGYGDFIKHLNDSGILFKCHLYSAPMQGADAPAGIAAAFEAINEHSSDYDVVVMIRGGGSNLDLACFDDYLIARSIALCYLPVISGIGHERDNHICDDVAAVRVKTPTGAADYLIERFADQAERVNSLEERLLSAAAEYIAEQQARIDNYYLRLSSVLHYFVSQRESVLNELKFRVAGAAVRRVEQADASLELIKMGLQRAATKRFESAEATLELLKARFESADPTRVLGRGYGIVTSQGEKIGGVAALREGMRIKLIMSDGQAEFTIGELNIKENKQD